MRLYNSICYHILIISACWNWEKCKQFVFLNLYWRNRRLLRMCWYLRMFQSMTFYKKKIQNTPIFQSDEKTMPKTTPGKTFSCEYICNFFFDRALFSLVLKIGIFFCQISLSRVTCDTKRSTHYLDWSILNTII